jgi:Glycosyltransferase
VKKILLLATTPFLNDGLTKIEMDIFRYNKEVVHFSVASAFGFNNPFGKEFSVNGVRCYELKPKKHVLQYMKSIYEVVSGETFDTVYIHGNSAMMFMEALPVWLSGKSKIITHCHSTNSKYPVFHKIFKPFFNKIVTKKIACSKAAARWAYSGNNTEIVVNGVDIAKFAFNRAKRVQIRNELGWDKNFIVGHVGRFVLEKNHAFLIRVFDMLQKQIPEARLLLIGSGSLESDIKSQVKAGELSEKVAFLGDTEYVSDYLQAMDLFIFPSLYEGFGLTVIEAQANGMPVLASDTVPEEVIATECVKVISLKDPVDDWVKMAASYRSAKRKETKNILRGKGFDLIKMMSKIQKILLEN